MWFVYIMLSNALWSVSDVSASMLVNKLEKSPLIVGWYLAIVHLLTLGLLALVLPLEIVWLWQFALAGAAGYAGMLSLLWLLKHVDVSVSSAAWVFTAIGMVAGGFFFFQESWNMYQTIGSCLSIAGILLLAFWHKHVSLLRTCTMLAAVGLSYVPFFLIQKAALLEGISVLNVFFWPILFQQIFAFLVPIPSLKSRLRNRGFIPKILLPWSILMAFLVTMLALLGFFFETLAYDAGMASLVGVGENGQPFFLMFFAWIATLLAPKYAPKELVTAQSFGIKIVSFCIVFIGLGLLTVQ